MKNIESDTAMRDAIAKPLADDKSGKEIIDPKKKYKNE